LRLTIDLLKINNGKDCFLLTAQNILQWQAWIFSCEGIEHLPLKNWQCIIAIVKIPLQKYRGKNYFSNQ
jgi:hypothetical protein